MSDNGTYYAAKDFWDSLNGRRILWGWAQIPNGAQALPRVVTWNPELQQLVFSPLAEQVALRGPPLYDGGPRRARVGGGGAAPAPCVPVGPWSDAEQAEVLATFALPRAAATFGVGVLGALEVFVEFVPGGADATGLAAARPWQVRVGVRPAGPNSTHPASPDTPVTRFMAETDLNGGDYNKAAAVGRHLPPGTDPRVCQAECDAAAECVAWTYVIRGEPAGSGDCCLKKMAPTGSEPPLSLCPHHAATCTSGVKTPRNVSGCAGGGKGGKGGAAEARLSLLPADEELEIRVFTDHTIVEVFFAKGRVALTLPLPLPLPASGAGAGAGFTLFSNAAEATAVAVQGWQVGDIWTTPEEVAGGA